MDTSIIEAHPMPAGTLGIAHFLAQGDALSRVLLAILLIMSLVSWYFIAAKALGILLERRRGAKFLTLFWNAPSVAEVARRLEASAPDEAFSQLTWQAIEASRHHKRHGASRLEDVGHRGEFLTRAMRRAIDQETARLESGLAVLASVGSTAPFIGLFGTVWGVYHALVNIGLSGQGSLDQVAGPVGEALIMTALGLAVAIPAVLAYNAVVRSNRVVLSQLDGFAHDLHAVLTTGEPVGTRGSGAATRTPLHDSAGA